MFSPNCRIASRAAILVLACLGCEALHAEVLVFNPIADTSLIEIAPDANLGGAAFFNAGTTGHATGFRNRALMQFALSETIPAGSIINSATLTLDVVRQPAADLAPSTFGLHRVFTAWGEGDKMPEFEGSPGLGAPATAGEATWLFRFLGGAAWAEPGGQADLEFAAAPSSTAFVYGIGDPVNFESTLDLMADVQSWVNNPQSNFGWMLMTEDESVRRSARSFASSEDGGGGPVLVVDFTPVPEPATLTVAGLAGLAWWYRRRHRS
jgi:hypothetical protein